MKRVVGMAVGLAVLVGIGGALMWLRPDPTGMAIGGRDRVEEEIRLKLWHALQPSSATYLKAWGDELAKPPDDPMLVIDAFNEVAYAVTGPAGLWRKTVPNRYLGCQADPESPPCVTLKSADHEFTRWDALQQRLSKVERAGQARRALRAEGAAMQEYLQTMVPQGQGLAALQETPFFAKNLAPVLP